MTEAVGFCYLSDLVSWNVAHQQHFDWIRAFFREFSSSSSNWLPVTKHRVVEELITTYPAGISAENLVSVPQSSYVLP